MISLLLKQIASTQSSSALERAMQRQCIEFIEAFGTRAFERSNLTGHLTASAWIIDRETKSHALLLHHRKLGRWLQPGGHADGETDLFAVAKKEVAEETGLTEIEGHDEIFDFDVHPIPIYADVPAHLHFDMRYLFYASRTDALSLSPESNQLLWVPFSEFDRYAVDSSVMRLRDRTPTAISVPSISKN